MIQVLKQQSRYSLLSEKSHCWSFLKNGLFRIDIYIHPQIFFTKTKDNTAIYSGMKQSIPVIWNTVNYVLSFPREGNGIFSD